MSDLRIIFDASLLIVHNFWPALVIAALVYSLASHAYTSQEDE